MAWGEDFQRPAALAFLVLALIGWLLAGYVWYDASRSEVRRIAREALALSPECLDAWLALGLEQDDPKLALASFEQGIARGRCCGFSISVRSPCRRWAASRRHLSPIRKYSASTRMTTRG